MSRSRINNGEEMTIQITEEERVFFLVTMLGGANKLIHEIYELCDTETRDKVMEKLAAHNQQLEPVMDMYGLGRDAEALARAMALSEDVIGCEPRGELQSAGPDEAVRKVTDCPWKDVFTADTCRFQMATLEKGLASRYGLTVTCEQTMADGADCCIWRVKKSVD